MTTQYTSILKLALPVQGELSGTWGDVVNDNITSMVEEAIAGRAVIDSWTTNSHTLTSANGTTSESRCAMLEFTDTTVSLSGDATVICPTAAKIYICKNDAGQKVTIKTSAGTGVAIADGQTMFVFCDGTNVVEAVTSMSSLKLGTVATSVQVTAILDEDNMASDSATSLATQQSIKAYVDAQVTAQDLDFGGDSGTGSVDLDSQSLTIAGTSNEIETSASGQTLTVGLPAAVTVTTSVTTPTVQVTDVKANDGTAAVSIADTTGQTTITDAVLTTADINAGTIDNTTIGATTASTGAFTTVTSSGNTTVSGTLVTDTIAEETATAGVTIDSVLLKDGGATLTGDLLVGNTSTVTTQGGPLAAQIIGANATSGLDIFTGGASALPRLNFTRSRNATPGSNTIVQDGDLLGFLSFMGDDGADYQPRGAQIKAEVDGTPGVNDMPGRLIFATTSDGADSSTERMRIDSSGRVGINSVPAGSRQLEVKNPTGGNAYLSAIRTNATSSELVLGAENGNTVLSSVGAIPLLFVTDGSEAMRIDSSQRVLIGGQSDTLSVGGIAALLQVENTSGSAAISIARHTASVNSGYLNFGKSRGADATIVQENDYTGFIQWAGADGTDINSYTAYISSAVDGTPGANDMPGRLMFWTTADGASAPTERMRIDNAGRVGIGATDPSSFNGSANQLVISGSSNTGLTIDATSTTESNIFFADGADGTEAYRGIIRYHHIDDSFRFFTNGGTEALRIDQNQRVLIGLTSSDNVASVTDADLQIETTGIGAAIVSNAGAAGPAGVLALGHKRGAGGVVSDGDALGDIRFAGHDGTDLESQAGQIRVAVDGTPGSNDMPGRLMFYTTADGAASATERMRITSTGYVGVGETAPDVRWHSSIDTATEWNTIYNLSNSNNIPIYALRLDNNDTSITGSEVNLLFSAGASGSGQHSIGVKRTGTNTGDMIFRRRNGGSSAESMRITSNGYVGIGTDSPVGALTIIQVGGDNDHGIRLQCNDDGSSTAPDIQLYKNSASPADGDNIGAIWWRANNSVGDEETYAAIYGVTRDVSDGSEDGSISFGTTNNGSFSVRSQIHQNGVYVNPEGICLGTASYDTYAAANTLDDYEEGQWTPTLKGGTSAGGASYIARYGWYTKIGNIVQISMVIAANNVTGTGDMIIDGLPFTTGSGSIDSVFSFQWNANSWSGPTAEKQTIIPMLYQTNNTTIGFRASDYRSSYAHAQVQLIGSGSITYSRITGTYRVGTT